VVGFIAGSANPRGFYSRLLKRDWLRFSFVSLASIWRRPQTVRRIARAFFHPSENPVGDEVAGLYSIGVLPKLQGTGVGKQLVLRFLEEARTRGCVRIFLTTDRDNNYRVNTFYQKLGFAVKRQYETPEGRKMNEYWVDVKA
jgi:GNAT superfamily N-acetyltransferase